MRHNRFIAGAILMFITMLPTSIKAQEQGLALQYLVRNPGIPSEHPPLLLLLHGVGSNENDLFSIARGFPQKYLVISARAPLVLEPNKFAWYQVDFSGDKPKIVPEQEASSRALLVTFIEQLIAKYNVNPAEVYLCGFSQGAIMSYSVALTRPDLVKGIAVMSGRLLEEVRPQIAAREKLNALRVFIAHGQSDTMLPIHYAVEAEQYLKSIGITPVLKQYPAGHEITQAMFRDLVEWLRQ